MVTVDKMIAALLQFRDQYGGDRQVVQIDPSGMHHFMVLDDIGLFKAVVVEGCYEGYFDKDDDENPNPNAVPVFVVNEG